MNQCILHIIASVTKPLYNISPKKAKSLNKKPDKHEANKIIFSYQCENH